MHQAHGDTTGEKSSTANALTKNFKCTWIHSSHT